MEASARTSLVGLFQANVGWTGWGSRNNRQISSERVERIRSGIASWGHPRLWLGLRTGTAQIIAVWRMYITLPALCPLLHFSLLPPPFLSPLLPSPPLLSCPSSTLHLLSSLLLTPLPLPAPPPPSSLHPRQEARQLIGLVRFEPVTQFSLPPNQITHN